MRRALTLIAAVIVLVGIGLAVYFYLSSRGPGVEVAPSDTTLPTAGDNITPPDGDAGSTDTVISGPSGVPARLVQISKGPVVPGTAVVNLPPEEEGGLPDVSVSYIERQSGNVFHYLTRAGTITRTSNRTIPGIQSAAWLPDASIAFVRYLSGTDSATINTYALPADGTNGFFLSQNLHDISVSSTSVLTLASGVNGSAASVEHTDGTKSSAAFTTPLSSLRASFAGKSTYLAFTKPSSALAGSAYLVDATGHFSRVAGPLSGLVALASPLGKWVIVSYVKNDSMQMSLINTTTNETFPLPVTTIADKCVWAADDSSVYCGIPLNPSRQATLPDDWYQGVVQFSDRIWKIDVSGRFAQVVLDFSKETNNSLDATALAVDPLGTTLSFMNKTDGSLWSYQL